MNNSNKLNPQKFSQITAPKVFVHQRYVLRERHKDIVYGLQDALESSNSKIQQLLRENEQANKRTAAAQGQLHGEWNWRGKTEYLVSTILGFMNTHKRNCKCNLCWRATKFFVEMDIHVGRYIGPLEKRVKKIMAKQDGIVEAKAVK